LSVGSFKRGEVVELRTSERRAVFGIEDHGKGFALSNGHTGIGLIAMRERAGILGGTLSVGPAVTGGTLVQLRIPRDKVEVHGE